MDYHFLRAVGKMRSTNDRQMLEKTKPKLKTYYQREPNTIEAQKKTKIHYFAPDDVFRDISSRILQKTKPLIDIPIPLENGNIKSLRITVQTPGILKYS